MNWNVRGLGLEVKIAMARRLVRIHKVNVCFFTEDKIRGNIWDLVRKYGMIILSFDM